jgi:hypothetical protein
MAQQHMQTLVLLINILSASCVLQSSTSIRAQRLSTNGSTAQKQPQPESTNNMTTATLSQKTNFCAGNCSETPKHIQIITPAMLAANDGPASSAEAKYVGSYGMTQKKQPLVTLSSSDSQNASFPLEGDYYYGKELVPHGLPVVQNFREVHHGIEGHDGSMMAGK